MAHLPPQPTLRTTRLLLRPLALGDADDIFDYARDPAVLRFTTGRTPRQRADSEAFVRGAMLARDSHSWAICLLTGGPVIGVIEFGLGEPECGSLHYALGVACWGQGLMTEAVRAVCTWAFGTIATMSVIETSVVVDNVASSRVLEKVGFGWIRRAEERWEKETSPVPLNYYALPRTHWSGAAQP